MASRAWSVVGLTPGRIPLRNRSCEAARGRRLARWGHTWKQGNQPCGVNEGFGSKEAMEYTNIDLELDRLRGELDALRAGTEQSARQADSLTASLDALRRKLSAFAPPEVPAIPDPILAKYAKEAE
jgi:hypothetical protein